MPFSDSEHKKDMVEWVKQFEPRFIVDVGVGCGTYSDLMRDKLKQHWIGIEVWAPYVTRYNLEKKYDHLVIGDIRFLDLQRIDSKPDLVIIGDCLEHLVTEDAIQVIKRLQSWSKNIIISLPIGDCPQGAWEGNAFERHLSTWSHEQVRHLFDGSGWIVEERRGKLLSAFWWTRP